MKRLTGLCLIIAIVFSMTACKKGDNVKESTLYIESGKVTEAIIESSETDYNEKELTDWVETAVKEYNKEAKDALEIEKCEVEKDTAKVTITYQSLKDYSSFNHVKAFEGTITEAQNAGYELEGEFTSTKGKPAVTYAELEGSKEYHVIILEVVTVPQTVVLEEDVLYVSSNVKANGKQAKVKEETKELAYMIYKNHKSQEDRLAESISGGKKKMEKTMEKIVALAKSRGFVYPGSEIYGGLANTWDYGNLGVELKNNVKRAWWQKFVQENPYNVGVDCAILMNPQTWVASGHLGGFSDPLMDCRECHERFRADKLIEDYCEENHCPIEGSVDGWSKEQMESFIEEKNICCPSCGKHNFTEIRQFNLMFKTFQGVTEDAKNTVYLRPETAQGIFVNFKNVQRTSRKKIPFGICQIGKSFRNEITPGNFTFRTREFEQMELEFFCEPGTDLEWFNYWRSFCRDWLISLGMKESELRLRDHDPAELAFYSKATTDFEFLFPFGWGELWGIADRTDYDLKQHQEVSKEDMSYFDDEKKDRYVPYVIEPSLGADRMVLAFLCSAYDEEELEGGDMRTVLRFHPALAPVKIGVLPLSKKLSEGAEKIYTQLCKKYNCEYDDRGNIGKRYRRQDEIGTPFCVTYDFESEEDEAVTVRDRDSMEQERIKIADLEAYFADKFAF